MSAMVNVFKIRPTGNKCDTSAALYYTSTDTTTVTCNVIVTLLNYM